MKILLGFSSEETNAEHQSSHFDFLSAFESQYSKIKFEVQFNTN